jgi:hypothetical protein
MYSFCYDEEKSEIVLVVNNDNRASISSVDWIKKQLFPKIIKWAETAVTEDRSNRLVTSSLNLVNIAKYNKLYQQLKKKYGLQMVQVKLCLFTRYIHENICSSRIGLLVSKILWIQL